MKQKQDFSLIITTVLIILLMVFLYLGGVFASLDKKFIDVVTVANLNANKAGKNNVAFAIISDATLKLTERFYKMGWPWRREMYGRVAEFTRLCGAKNTIYDFHFTERSVFQVSQTKPYREIDDDGAFAAAIKKNGNVILAYQNLTRASKSTQKTINPHFLKHALTVIKNDNSVHFKDYPAIYGPIHPLLKATSGVGCVNTSLDSDGIARRIRLVYKYRGKFYPGLSLASYMQSKKIKQVSIINKTIKVGDISIPVDKNGFYRVKFYGDNNVYYDFNLLYMFLALDKVKRHYSLYSKLINKTPHFTIEEVCRDKRKYSTMLKQVNDVRRKRHVSAKKFKPLTVPIAGMKRWKKNGKYLKPVPLFPWTLHNKYVIVASIASSLQDV